MKKIFFWFQGGSNPWPHDYWPDALTTWAMFFSKPNYFHQAVNYSLHWTNKNRYPRSMRPFFGMGKIALYNEQFLLRIIGLCWPIFQWSRFFFLQCLNSMSKIDQGRKSNQSLSMKWFRFEYMGPFTFIGLIWSFISVTLLR